MTAPTTVDSFRTRPGDLPSYATALTAHAEPHAELGRHPTVSDDFYGHHHR